MNLLKDPWIPVKRQSGKQELIAPCAITDQYTTDPVAFLAAPRPDFNGSLMQFLIGLLQTAFAPEFKELERTPWRRFYKNPPSKDELQTWFMPLESAFELDSDGARFMQDFDKKLPGEQWDIAALLLENPGDNTIKKNTDHFIKRGLIKGLCKSCAATALFNLQINAPSGGSGHRTSLRGGGPLTTLIVEKNSGNLSPTLWRNLWLNVLPTQETILSEQNHQLKDIFPWLAPTRLSDKEQSTTLEDVHPMQMFWSMPRRIRLNFSKLKEEQCDLCGVLSQNLLINYVTKKQGINYTSETFRHPLTPYYQDKNNLYLPTHLSSDGLGYKHWLSIALSGNDRKNAKVVRYCSESRYDLAENSQCSIWAFGYDTDNMKARCFYESYLPFYHIKAAILEDFVLLVASVIEAASIVLSYVKTAIKQAWFQSPKEVKGNVEISKEFWGNTEAAFYTLLNELKTSLEAGNGIEDLKIKWFEDLRKEAFLMFQCWAESSGIEFENMRRMGEAHRDLCKKLYGPKLRGILNLPKKD